MYIHSIWLANLSIYPKIELFLYLPPKAMRDIYIDAVMHFCIAEISGNIEFHTFEYNEYPQTLPSLNSSSITS